MNLVIIKYNAGNIQSVLYALERIGLEAKVTDDVEEISGADKVIFPGVGEASSAMRYLKDRKLDEVIKNLTQPVLGICLGMQLMCRFSEENNVHCLHLFDEDVKLFRNSEAPRATEAKIPQIGWNTIYDMKSELFHAVPERGYVYFVHSYYAALGTHTIATADYLIPYSAALHKNNFYGVQFHPEKSADMGERILKNFVERCY
ncbi:MAG: imidazole glycerol phosphate synthase subunit HisH [Chitinophagaceae bacterium]|nr:imidazole glycerol phosphate synthase subunit HisH [Chitinophagaceae bacterium]